MPTKIRLARHGRKSYAYYHIVVADSRAPRDGRFIERIGSYNPNTDPATIDLDFDKALNWLEAGAQPTDTARSILSREGVLMKKHLNGGVKKGAFDEAEAEKRFTAWLEGKTKENEAYKSDLAAKAAKEEEERLALESKINEERAAELAAKKSELAGEAEAAVAEETAEEAPEASAEAAEETKEGEE